MSDFKAPDVVWIDKETLTVIQDCKSTTNGYIGIPDASEVDVKLGDTYYTLTTTAEANTRKAVREALEELKRIAEEDVYTAEQHLAANRAGMVIYKMKGYRAAFDQLLTQYQEVAS